MQKPITNEKVARMEKLSDEIATLSANINVANYRLLTLIHEFDEGKGWGYQNARSSAHWPLVCVNIASHFGPPMHPVRRRCSSIKYPRYSPSSRLAGRVPRHPIL